MSTEQNTAARQLDAMKRAAKNATARRDEVREMMKTRIEGNFQFSSFDIADLVNTDAAANVFLKCALAIPQNVNVAAIVEIRDGLVADIMHWVLAYGGHSSTNGAANLINEAEHLAYLEALRLLGKDA